jgi:prepilin-type N-terminal cleavage/methylation domain-containing protein
MRRSGFTLIEILIVMVILGILAAIAMPKLGKTRERAYFKAVMYDLRNLQTQQEIYFSAPQNQSYASTTAAIANFVTSELVTVTITEAGTTGWAATATHGGLDTPQWCAVYTGTVGTVPPPAAQPSTVTCTGE